MRSILIMALLLAQGLVVNAAFDVSRLSEFKEKLYSDLEKFSLEKTFPTKLPGAGGMQPHQIALTFDDGPTPGTTSSILNTLARYNAVGTFFVHGVRAKKYPHLLREIASKGHKLANHGWSHSSLVGSWGGDQVINSLKRTHDLIENFLDWRNGRDLLLYRNPGGYWSKGRARLLNDTSRSGVLSKYVGPFWWNVGGGVEHYRGQQINIADQNCSGAWWCAEYYYRKIKHNYNGGKGSLVLLHDLHKVSADMLPILLGRLRDDNVRWQFIFVQDIPAVRRLAP